MNPSVDRIVPKPLRAAPADGSFVISPATAVEPDIASGDCAQRLVDLLAPALGVKLAVTSSSGATNCIRIRVDPDLARLTDEGYRLDVSPQLVTISAPTAAGVFWGVQTLRQLLPTQSFSTSRVDGVAWEIPCCTIEDRPRFRWRGLMLDCARHFMPIKFLYKWIDLLSLHKLNVFHWHLTDDQGWRVEIRKYPKLTELGAWRRETLVGHALPVREKYAYDGARHGGYYSRDDIKRLVRYAASRNVTIVPEIEMPGHSQAAIAAYPELGNTNTPLDVWTHWGVSPHILNADESTIEFYQNVLDEVMELFPSQFIHVGGDEAPKDQWKASPRAQSRMKQLGLADENELQSWFIRRMDAFLAKRGRRLIGWDEILEGGLAPGAAVMSWRGEEGGVAAARAGHDVVMAPQKRVYFDHYQSDDHAKEGLAIGGLTRLKDVYAYEPVPPALTSDQAAHVLGAQGQLWTEYIPTPARLEYMAFPRACALAEVVWSAKETRDPAEFESRLRVHLERLTTLGVNFRGIAA